MMFHRHRMQPIDVTHGRFRILGRLGGQATIILRRCGCGHYDTETVDGHWPAERFLPPKEIDR